MILQLKVSLKDMKPPVWRRLQVDEKMTFYDFHDALQIAFEWNDAHLHVFDVRKSRSERIPYPTMIGLNETNDFMNYQYDEREERLGDWLVNEKDRIVYTYDFGDDWEHEIVLEKRLPIDENTTYPNCVKAMRVAPPEDSRGDLFEGFVEIEEIPTKELTADISEELAFFFTDEYAYGKKEKDDWPLLLSLAEEFKALQPWQWMSDYQLFAIEDPETEELCFCSVMGAAGEEFGLAAYIGAEGFHFLRKLFNDEIDESNHLKQRSIVFCLSDRNELSNDDYDLLKTHGFSYRGKKQWPQFRSFHPNHFPWKLDSREVQLMSTILKQAIEVCKQAKLNSILFDVPDTVFIGRRLDENTGKWKDVNFEVAYAGLEKPIVPLLINEMELQKLRNETKTLNIKIEFGIEHLPTPTQDSPDERPYYPTVLIGVDKKTGMIVFNEIINRNQFNLEEGIQHGIVNMIERLKGIPREIWIKENNEYLIDAIARKLKIRLMTVQSLRHIEEVMNHMKAFY
ncbi:plasmid pRiA4b ORF-3 family protein [Bacillus carboniphilus]|uniref:Plasmid pRiA4b ORF-3 family protein n=1 Tax=Bacillus carboniphilus TaxID=86663 RepID=A0ABY9JQ64_9BACI|nr:plasmid pRiA4b ORF-3 family protein [Bacillus carboniphilus]WLR41541.1 plasmid pRiA4b ORF-3 family protein [Bacillus carboniphilus]